MDRRGRRPPCSTRQQDDERVRSAGALRCGGAPVAGGRPQRRARRRARQRCRAAAPLLIPSTVRFSSATTWSTVLSDLGKSRHRCNGSCYYARSRLQDAARSPRGTVRGTSCRI